MQLDESRNKSGLAQLMVLVRYIANGKLEEELFMCVALSGTCTGEDILSSGYKTTQLRIIMGVLY